MPRLNSFLGTEGKLVCLELRSGERGVNLILSAARDRLLGNDMPLRVPKARSPCCVKKVLEEGQSQKEDMVWLTF